MQAAFLAIDTAQIGGPIVGALAVIIVGAFTMVGTFRTSQRSASAAEAQRISDREQRSYANVVADRDKLRDELDEAETECDQMRKERNQAVEDYNRLRLRIFRAGLDPDTIGTDGSPR